jgi:hypothetical protein
MRFPDGVQSAVAAGPDGERHSMAFSTGRADRRVHPWEAMMAKAKRSATKAKKVRDLKPKTGKAAQVKGGALKPGYNVTNF